MTLDKLTRREFLKKTGKIGLGGLLTASGISSLTSCKKKKENDGVPVNDDYYIDVYCLDMTSLDGMNFKDRLLVGDAVINVNDRNLNQSEYTSNQPGHFRFSHKGHSIRLNYSGSVHDTVICVRAPGSNENIYQVQNGRSATVNLQNLMQGNDVDIELYKIPSWVNVDWVREALQLGSAVYNHNVAVYLVNEEYTNREWPQAKQNAIPWINNALNEINPCLVGITATLNPNADTGDLKVRLGKSNLYINPSTGWNLSNGIINDSNIMISAPPLEVYYYLEELYHALGVRNDIRRGDTRLADEISNDTDKLNRFGKALKRINNFLNPDTHL